MSILFKQGLGFLLLESDIISQGTAQLDRTSGFLGPWPSDRLLVALGACPRLAESTADVLEVARSSDPFRGMLKKAASCVLGLLARGAYTEYVSTPKARERSWTAFFNIPRFR